MPAWIRRRRIRANNAIERLNRAIRRHARIVGTFPDDKSAIMLVCARLKYVAGSEWGEIKMKSSSRFDGNNLNTAKIHLYFV